LHYTIYETTLKRTIPGFMINANRGLAKLIRSGFIQSLSNSFNSDRYEWFSSEVYRGQISWVSFPHKA